MTDYRHLNESQLAKLSIDELKQVVKSMKLAKLHQVQQKEHDDLQKKRVRNVKMVAERENAAGRHFIGAPVMKPKVLKTHADESVAPSTKKSKRISAEKRIELLERELEVAKGLDSSFSNGSNEEKRRRLAQLRRSLVREKHRQTMKKKRETEHYHAPVTPAAAWKKSLRSELYEPAGPAKKFKRPSSATKRRVQRRKSFVIPHVSTVESRTTPVASAKKKRTRPQSAQRTRASVAASPSSVSASRKRRASTSKSNAKIAHRLQDIENQIMYLEQRLSKRTSNGATSATGGSQPKKSSSDGVQLRQISEQLSSMESKQSKMRHTVRSLKKNIEMIHESQGEQKTLMERLTRAVIKHRRQQQEYNDNFDARMETMQLRTDSIEDQQHKLRVKLIESGGDTMSARGGSSMADDSISVFSPASDTRTTSGLLSESDLAANPNAAGLQKQQLNSASASSRDFVSKYSKLKQAFHRVYGARNSAGASAQNLKQSSLIDKSVHDT
eukprot:CAMPEP_0117435728 /NCGR_PEP_ID=MMETSP0759-20121206/632_1 /TAXON_ID=63605 /ORGANISM="Percolomonas cosmopolitus, Strain WS" /LENGTH=498 /DNA_ID=CAMNT_0005227287 /DNA_START=264 /DNA_END=1757 /DNA_ORIENTATION=+